ncbi:MAG: 50S ribosomal protein L32 [Candidatus Eisenbacteria bacterium]|nr:50S ribosomal protein L32 [Candidatus Eisenbacteria bacterium]
MALPKRRHSKTRRDKRRTHWKLTPPTLSACSHCGQPKLPHRVCPNCGYYNDEVVVFGKET